MKITGTTVFDKKDIRKKRAYRKKDSKKTPLIAMDFDKEKEGLFSSAVLDLTNVVDIELLQEEQEAIIKVGKAKFKKMRVDVVADILKGNGELSSKKPPLKAPKIKLKKGGKSLVILFSDWHYGKVIKTKSGKAIFNSEIAHKRIQEELVPKIIENIRSVGAVNNIEEVVVVLAGDIVDNDIIYDTQRFQIDSGVAVQFDGVARALMGFFVMLKEEFKRLGNKDIPVRIECITGNHGRSGKVSDIPVCSWDTALYSSLDLALRYSSLTNIDLHFSLEEFHIFNVRGHRALVVHQAPPQGESPAAKKKFGGWYEIFDYDMVMYGHLHHWGASCYNGRPLLMNGSLCGYDEFAIGLGVRDEWSQLMWTVTDEKPVEALIGIN
jgi:predicted phosphodiesterase